MNDNLLTVTVERFGRRVVVHVSGEVDMGTKSNLEDVLVRAFAGEPPAEVIVDLIATTFLASAGLATLLDARVRAADTKTSMALVVVPGSAPERAITITAVDELFPRFDSLDLALSDSP